MNQNLPKVLILGQTFTNISGGGITLGSLFKDWPKEKLAVAVSSKDEFDFSKSSNYYRIGYNELKMPFPFFYFQRRTKSGVVRKKFSKGEISVKKNSNVKNRIKVIFDRLLEHLGIDFWIYGNEKISEPFIRWVNEFRPDLIYYQPNSYKSISFVLQLKPLINVPLISHVMDDWFTFCIKPSPFFFYWKSRIDKKVKQLFSETQLHLSICDYMSKEYLDRYGYKFFPFHHSIEIEFWNKYHRHKSPTDNPYVILYAGRIGYGIDRTLFKVASAIEKEGKKLNIRLEIQTKDLNHPLLEKIKNYRWVKISRPIEYNLLPKKFCEVDALLIPYDFKGSGIKFIKYSMPTKVSEYMATGTPIIVIGPTDTGLIQYAKSGWAKVCEEDCEEAIIKCIVELKGSKKLQNEIIETSKKMVLKNHSSVENIKSFRSHLISLLDTKKRESVTQHL